MLVATYILVLFWQTNKFYLLTVLATLKSYKDHGRQSLTANTLYLQELEFALQIFNYFFTSVFILEAAMKIIALGTLRYMRDR